LSDEEALTKLINCGFLVSHDLKDCIKENEVEPLIEFINKNFEKKPCFLNKDIYDAFKNTSNSEKKCEVVEVEKAVNFKRENIELKVYAKKNYVHTNRKLDINDWVNYYLDRYHKLSEMLKNRDELKGVLSISKLKNATGRVAVIGMVKDIQKTNNNNYILTLEDPTDEIKVFLKGEIAKKAEEIVYDEVLGVAGSKNKDIIYADNLVFPDIPERPIKKAEDEIYAAFISDIHVGSNMFLPKEFQSMIDWLNGKVGDNLQMEMAKKVKYLFITGDLVDGVGIYPGQEKELLISDIFKQYESFSKYIEQIPDDIKIIVCPGNHDALRLDEPQHAIFRDMAEALYKKPNVTMVSNPSLVNIHNVGKFPGFDILMYHGYSFDHYVSEVPSLRKYGYERADKIMEFLLKKRHLAPTHGSTVITPAPQDFLIIDKLPDAFVTGHIHMAKVGRYKNILTVSSSCFQDRTAFQEKLGHHPEPGRVPIMNLQKNEVKMLRFR